MSIFGQFQESFKFISKCKHFSVHHRKHSSESRLHRQGGKGGGGGEKGWGDWERQLVGIRQCYLYEKLVCMLQVVAK